MLWRLFFIADHCGGSASHDGRQFQHKGVSWKEVLSFVSREGCWGLPGAGGRAGGVGGWTGPGRYAEMLGKAGQHQLPILKSCGFS